MARFSIILFYILLFSSCAQEKSIHLVVTDNLETMVAQPIGFDINEFSKDRIDVNEPLVLMQAENGKLKEIPFQLEEENNLIWFNTLDNKNRKLEYVLKNGQSSLHADIHTHLDKADGSLRMSLNNMPVLSYRFETIYPPIGVDSIFKKSGYVHPVIALSGDTLSRIHPKDHYHHYGLWGPYTHTQVEGKRIDFWNIGDGTGTVAFKQFDNYVTGPVFAEFTATQEHINLEDKQKPTVALNEKLSLRLWNLNSQNRYMFDYKSEFTTPLKKGILLEAYRYGGGLAMRFNKHYKADNCTILTSEGDNRATADGASAKWCMVTGNSAQNQKSNGILFMSHPANRNGPSPMRVWPKETNEGRGDLMFEFTPIRNKAWNILPNKNYELNYRMVVFDGRMTAEEANAYYERYKNATRVLR